jgi:hypothetical protein
VAFVGCVVKVGIKISISRITYENLVFRVLVLREYIKNGDKVIIFCNCIRYQKVFLQATLLYNGLCEFEIVCFDRLDTHPKANAKDQFEEVLLKDLQNPNFDLY